MRSDVGLKSILELKQALSEPSPRQRPTQSLAALPSQNAKQKPQSFELDLSEDSLEDTASDPSPAEQTHAFNTSLSHIPITAQQPEAESRTNYSRNMVTTFTSPGSAAEAVVSDAVSPVPSLAHESASNAQAGSSVVNVTADSAVLHAADQVVASPSVATGAQEASMAAAGLQSSAALVRQLTELGLDSSDEVGGHPCQVCEATETAGTTIHRISRHATAHCWLVRTCTHRNLVVIICLGILCCTPCYVNCVLGSVLYAGQPSKLM